MARRRRPPRPGGRPRGRRRRPPKPRKPTGPVIPDTPEARFEEEVRKDVVRLMGSLTKDRGLVEEERLLARIMEQHPEYGPSFADAETYHSQGVADSAFIHLGLHRLVEQRVVTREIARLDPGKSWHDAVHEHMELVAAELFGSQDLQEEAS